MQAHNKQPPRLKAKKKLVQAHGCYYDWDFVAQSIKLLYESQMKDQSAKQKPGSHSSDPQAAAYLAAADLLSMQTTYSPQKNGTEASKVIVKSYFSAGFERILLNDMVSLPLIQQSLSSENSSSTQKDDNLPNQHAVLSHMHTNIHFAGKNRRFVIKLLQNSHFTTFR